MKGTLNMKLPLCTQTPLRNDFEKARFGNVKGSIFQTSAL